MMSGIRGTNTKIEVTLRHALHRRGFRYRLHCRDLPGRPDIVLPKYQVAIFVHGCFWHGHTCALFKTPKTRTQFWLDKIDSNRRRDLVASERLLEKGWRLAVIWECALRSQPEHTLELLVDRISTWLKDSDATQLLEIPSPSIQDK
ncbi:very short patch repair endonuclease [Cupriavidus cauae]|nr:very short patch repair endonuclease [Cupriavidus cauae]